MTIWILSVVVVAGAVGLGWRLGVIRAGFSFFGIVLGALLARPLGHLVRPGLSAVGIKNPTLLWLLAPLIAFAVVLTIFKIAGFIAHQKASVYYKYHAGDLRLALWERLNRRLGICVGALNGAAYLVLICFIIYILGYWTVQLSSPNDGRLVRTFNDMSRDLQSTGMSKVAKSIESMPQAYYDTADVAGLLYHTPRLQARLNRYPAFLVLAERPEFQNILSDPQFTNSWNSQGPVSELYKNPSVQSVLKNPDQVKTVWSTVEPNLEDLQTYLTTDKSPKYESEPLLGRWDFNVNAAVALVRAGKPNMTAKETTQLRAWMNAAFAKTTLVAMTDQRVILKNVPHQKPATVPGTAPTIDFQNVEGRWKNDGGKYVVTLNIEGKSDDASGEIKNDRLTLEGTGLDLAFDREE